MPTYTETECSRQLEEAAGQVIKGMKTDWFSGRRILVTGGTGMIGNVLCAALKKAGAEVKAVGRPVGDMDLNIQGVTFLFNPTDIVHAAGYAQPAKFMSNQMQTIRLNTEVLMQMVEHVRKSNGRLVYLSSSEVYSGSPHLRHSEDDIGNTTPAHNRGCYIEGKRCGEAIIHAARAEGVQAMAARVSLAYGPGVKTGDTRVISQFIDQGIKYGEIALQDGGQARRTYCYVTDTVEMLMNILSSGRSPVYNVGGEGETTILSLARKIAAIMKVTVKVPRGMGVAMTGAPAHVSLDTGLYRREFGKRGLVPLEEGLKKTIDWHMALAGIKEGQYR